MSAVIVHGDDFSKIPSRLLIASLRSLVCPSCSKGKPAGVALCRPCLFQLDRELGNRLSMSSDYPKAFAEAMRKLMVMPIHFPDGVQRYGPGIYAHADRSLHFYEDEMLAVVGWDDTELNHQKVRGIMTETVRSIFGNVQTTVVDQ